MNNFYLVVCGGAGFGKQNGLKHPAEDGGLDEKRWRGNYEHSKSTTMIVGFRHRGFAEKNEFRVTSFGDSMGGFNYEFASRVDIAAASCFFPAERRCLLALYHHSLYSWVRSHTWSMDHGYSLYAWTYLVPGQAGDRQTHRWFCDELHFMNAALF